jgi:hypothetical protein
MDIINAIFTALSGILTGLGTLLSDAFSAAVSIIWTPGANNDPGSLTVVGVLFLLGVGMTLIFFAFKFIRGLVKTKG